MDIPAALGFDEERRLSLVAPSHRVVEAVLKSNTQINNSKVRLDDIFSPQPQGSEDQIRLSLDSQVLAALREKYGIQALRKVSIFLEYLLNRGETEPIPDESLLKIGKYRFTRKRDFAIIALIKRPDRSASEIRKIVSTNIGPLAHDLGYFPNAVTPLDTRRRINSNFRYKGKVVALQLGKHSEFRTPDEDQDPEAQHVILNSRNVRSIEGSLLCLASAVAIAYAETLSYEELPS